MTRHARGFSLIEMAFVLVIVTLLLGGLLVPFATQVEQKRIGETNKALEEIKEALIGYALSHGPVGAPHLPCPDANAGAIAPNINNDGLEDRQADGECERSEGNLPWATLGVGNQDAWGNRFHYRVTPAFSKSDGFKLDTLSSIDICSAAACATTIASDVPAVVVSYGKNGYGAINSNSAGALNSLPTSADELENQPGNNIYVSHTLILPGIGNTEFDDQVMWLSRNVLFNRMVAAGRLP